MTLDTRKGKILQAIVKDYVETAEPIGSGWLASHYDFGCRSATLRNEMAEMADNGYLVQPHTSAGRIPSSLGYRYYVDRLMEPVALPIDETRRAREAYELPVTEIDELVQLTCRLLSEMTNCLSVGTPPALDSVMLHRLYVTQASHKHALIVLLLTTGHVEHRLLELHEMPSEARLQRTGNYLSEMLAGMEISDIAHNQLNDIATVMMEDRFLLAAIHAGVVQSARNLSESRIFLEGTSHIMRQREFNNALRLEQLFSALQQRAILSKVLSGIQYEQEVTIIIGAECPIEAMQDCSLVTTRYHIKERTGGYIGVVGPTRMQYERAVAAVDLMANCLSKVLTQAILG